jgi:hypothetical protein
MEITTTRENLVENLIKQMTSNVISGLSGKDLDQEEIDATLVLNKKKIDNDANVIADLVFTSLKTDQPE